MNPVFDTFRPEGFHTLNAYLFSEQPEELIQFLKDAFFAVEFSRTMREEILANAILKIGDSSFMVSQANGPFVGMHASFYLFVNDVDGMHNRALAHGAEEEFPPADMPYGDRQSGVKDVDGNYWWISMRLVEAEYED